MIFPESQLSTYLGFFVPGGQVEPLLDRIAEVSSEFEEMDLVGFLHLAQRELELTEDVNRDDAAVVLIEELQLPLAEAAAVLEENPATTAARLQSAWADMPDQGTGPLPGLLSDGLIMLEPGLELDAELELDPALSIITPDQVVGVEPALEPESKPVHEPLPELEGAPDMATSPEVAHPNAATPIAGATPEPFLDDLVTADHEPVDESEAELGDEPGDESEKELGDEPEGEPVEALEGEHGEAPDEAAVAAEAGETHWVAGEAEAEPDTAHSDEPFIEPVGESTAAYDPYAALSPQSLEGSSQSFPWNPYDHGQPVSAASLLDLEDDPALAQGPSQPITHVAGRIPVAEILDGETDAVSAFPSHLVASCLDKRGLAELGLSEPGLAEGSSAAQDPSTDQEPSAAQEPAEEGSAEALAALLMDAAARGEELIYEDAPEADVAHVIFSDDHVAEVAVGAVDLMDTFGDGAPPDSTPGQTAIAGGVVPDSVTSDEGDLHDEAAEDAEGVPAGVTGLPPAPPLVPVPAAMSGAIHLGTAVAPFWMIGQHDSTFDHQPESQDWRESQGIPEYQGQPDHQEWPAQDEWPADKGWPVDPNPPGDADMAIVGQAPGIEDGNDTQQIPAMAMIAELAAAPDPVIVPPRAMAEPALSPSVERFLDDLHGAWIAGGSDVLQRPVSDVPLGGRFELAEPPAPIPAPPRPTPAGHGADLTNDDAVEATYEEELVPESPAPEPPAPAAVWIPGMAERAFRSSPWLQIESEDEPEHIPDLHGFGSAAYTPAQPVERQSPADKIQAADVAAFMAGGPADAPEWDGIAEGTWAHADYGPKRPKANRIGQICGLFALALALGVVYLYVSWPPIKATIDALGLPISSLVVLGALAGVLGVGGLSMFIGSSIPKQPKVKVVRRRRKRTEEEASDYDAPALGEGEEDGDLTPSLGAIPVEEEPGHTGEILTDVWEEQPDQP